MPAAFRTVALLLAMCAAGHAQKSDLHQFLAELQRAVQADDRRAIAGMLHYPITVSIAGLRVPFADAATLLDRYDDIFNPPLRDEIARASISQGVVIGANDIAIDVVGGAFRITRITVPEYTGTPPAAGQEREPGRIAIRVGPRPMQVSGLLANGATDVWIVFLPKGNLASVRLERAPAGSAAISVIHASTGAPLSARMAADARFVSGRPSEDGEYRIEVRRLASDDAHLPYMLSLSLR